MKMRKICFLSALCIALLVQNISAFSAEQAQAPVSTASAHLTPADSLKVVANNPDFVDLSTIPNVKINLKYATTDNFMKINMYGPFKTAYLHKMAAEKLKAAVEILKKKNPDGPSSFSTP